MLVRLIIILFIMLCVPDLGAQSVLKIPNIFASGMVLQQKDTVAIWGWGNPGANVKISNSWHKKIYKTKVDENGRWKVDILTPSASYDSQNLTISSQHETLLLNNVLIGDVWIVGGQSNMQMSFKGNPDQPTENAQKILLRCNHNKIRLFRVENGYSLNVCDTINGKWSIATPENVNEFSVIGYVFGEKIHNIENIPIGLIQSAHGGSVAEAWIDKETLEKFGEFDLNLEKKKIDPIWYSFEPTVLYNKMLAPMLPLSVKGVIWYQGESNVERPEQYRRLFPLLVRSWRKYFNKTDLPFYYVQIAPYNHANVNSAEFREVQLDLMDSISNVGMVVTLDVGEPDVIHPARKEIIGERLAYWALNCVYGHKAFECRGPEYRSMEVKDGHVFIKFNYASNGLSFMGKEPKGFEVAGEDRIFFPAKVRITPAFWGNEGLEIWNDSIKNPVAVRYGYTNYVDGTLFNTDGLPASSFRTDKW